MDGFANQKVIVVGGSSDTGREAASDFVSGGGSAVIVGRDSGRVDETLKTRMGEHGASARTWPAGLWSTMSARLGRLAPHKTMLSAVRPAVVATPLYDRLSAKTKSTRRWAASPKRYWRPRNRFSTSGRTGKPYHTLALVLEENPALAEEYEVRSIPTLAGLF